MVEIHVLQNHAPANLNRDESGSPKDCMFGGVRRGRISSQCQKRTIRCSPLFQDSIGESRLGMRTRKLPFLVKEELMRLGLSEELAKIGARKASGLGNKDGKERDDEITAQAIFLTQEDVSVIARCLFRHLKDKTVKQAKAIKAQELQKDPELVGWRPVTVDVALFGRMTTSTAFNDVEASVQVGHAISTHRVDSEFDYFTAVDDLMGDGDSGADMIGDTEFNSCCYYKYFNVDMDELKRNLAGPDRLKKLTAEERQDLARDAAHIVKAFIESLVFCSPDGKQNSFAARQLPSAVLVEVKKRKIPVSYANAFVKPVTARGEMDLVQASVNAFLDHVKETEKCFGLTPNRRWLLLMGCESPKMTTDQVSTFPALVEELTAALQQGEE
ncbi:crispr-associated protein, ct1973 family, putative [Heliomicrobium modesticaldum Ice1]|uniref:Crispr-associated protein, ct1973 family, putative n=1 Tax=Heliobacterium modesticaldum (strain ATCC 51547 / Ice1) TaxID=498761 RepID=B0TDU0_HELMI|nr:crispr-associated protein, ct1973 family, putative [Heliomicrobium modesticaldum Ice1]